MSSKLFSIFFVILFVAKTTAQNPSALYQNWVDAQVNNTTPTLPTFSYAGYHNGEISLPSSFSQQVYNVTDYGAVANDNKSDKNVAITKSTKSFNLISNPYTSYINSGAFLNLQTNADKLTSKTIWVWNPISKNHETKIAGEAFKIAPAQGFYVSCKTAGNLIFQETI